MHRTARTCCVVRIKQMLQISSGIRKELSHERLWKPLNHWSQGSAVHTEPRDILYPLTLLPFFILCCGHWDNRLQPGGMETTQSLCYSELLNRGSSYCDQSRRKGILKGDYTIIPVNREHFLYILFKMPKKHFNQRTTEKLALTWSLLRRSLPGPSRVYFSLNVVF